MVVYEMIDTQFAWGPADETGTAKGGNGQRDTRATGYAICGCYDLLARCCARMSVCTVHLNETPTHKRKISFEHR